MVLLIIRNPDRREELLERHKSMVDALIDLDGAGYVDFPYNVGHLNHITERFKDF
ncbi:MAG: hypothetical protein HN509_10660 [Halobacteriovoraceae bacterium]|nr:hypothetical protein [Halobacteriovoraceae bacterium]